MLSALEGLVGEQVSVHVVTVFDGREFDDSPSIVSGVLLMGLDDVDLLWREMGSLVPEDCAIVVRAVHTGAEVGMLVVSPEDFVESGWIDFEGQRSLRINLRHSNYTVILDPPA